MREHLDRSNKLVEHAVLILYDFQTEDEKVNLDTVANNGRGFTSAWAWWGCYLGKLLKNKTEQHLYGKFLFKARKLTKVHAGQLIEVANLNITKKIRKEQVIMNDPNTFKLEPRVRGKKLKRKKIKYKVTGVTTERITS